VHSDQKNQYVYIPLKKQYAVSRCTYSIMYRREPHFGTIWLCSNSRHMYRYWAEQLSVLLTNCQHINKQFWVEFTRPTFLLH